MTNSKGSTWKKWDLHIHTPCSLQHEYGGNSEDVWESFIQDLEKLPKEFKVIGINDYIFLDGYEKVLKYKLNGRLSNIDLILPVVELRIDKFGSLGDAGWKRVNFHVIFSDKVTKEQIEQQFLNAIFHSHILLPEVEDLNFSGVITKSSLADFGKKIKESSSVNIHGSDISVGFNNITYGYKEILDALKSTYFKDKFLTAVGKSEWDYLRWDGSISDKKTVINNANFVFISSETPEKFYNAKEKLKTEGVNHNLIDCSDAHNFSYKQDANGNLIKDRIGKCFTWIKSDSTFEGLKQVIYEPEDRVKIQELMPEEKDDYLIIDKVKFIDNNFSPDYIQINQNLTAIIGGKSTGKSVLLRSIAQAIDPKEVEYRLKEVNLPNSKEISDFRVIWKDKQENKKGENFNLTKKIIYIPQSYLNRLVDKKEDKTSIETIIKNVLVQDEVVKNVFTDLENLKREIEKSLTKNIENIFYVIDDLNKLSEEIKNIGDKKGITSEIEKLNNEINDLKKKSGMTESEIKIYNDLVAEHNSLKEKKEFYNRELENLKNIVNKDLFNFISFDEFSIDLQKSLNNYYSDLKNKFKSDWERIVNNEKDKIQIKNEENSILISNNSEKIIPLYEKVTKSKSLEEKIKKLETEEKKLKDITEEEEKLKKLEISYQTLIKEIIDNHSFFYEKMFEAKSKILEQTVIFGEIEFYMDIIFEINNFQKDFISEVCDLRKINQFSDGLLNEYKFVDNFSLKNDFDKIIKGILNGTITLKNSYSKKESITRLVRNWFVFDFKIKQNGDEIAEMSPGKKSFVLLKLLIELDNSKCPILLDQPEDDLDNRSIYNDLVKFIKSKKKDRQIIIATHNPNLVVGADAECVIVANQSGEQIGDQTYRFEYVGGSLENTFLNINEKKILYKQGIQEHVCEILEGGEAAFEKRKQKYNL